MTEPRTPEAIYALSAQRVRQALAGQEIPEHARRFVERMVHACGDPLIAQQIHASKTLAGAVQNVVKQKGWILCDSAMLEAGIMKKHINAAQLKCFLSKVATPGETRASCGMADVKHLLKNSVVVIGSAPTALVRLLDGIDQENWDAPAAIIATPVGFVGAEIAKQRLYNQQQEQETIPMLTLLGRKGGTAIAAAAFNACFISDLADTLSGSLRGS